MRTKKKTKIKNTKTDSESNEVDTNQGINEETHEEKTKVLSVEE